MEIKEFCRKHLKDHVVILVIIAIGLTLTIEILGRHSLVQALGFMFGHPLVFFCNMVLVLLVLSLSLLFRKRIFATVILAVLWLALGITNGIILATRMTPFNVKDLSNLGDGLDLVTTYFSPLTLAISLGVIVAIVLGCVVLYRKTPRLKGKIDYRKSLAVVAVIFIAAFGSIEAGMKAGVLDTFFGNLAYAYLDNGVPYSFLVTWLKTGIEKPSGYSEDTVLDIFDEGELGPDGIYTPGRDDEPLEGEKPNIIFLQLESFIDPTMVENVKFSCDPVPNFRSLAEKNSTGYITVPAVGAGTANTEFEIMTGLSVKFFGPGEYPYKSILGETSCETTGYDLKQEGYSTHAIHNHRGAFYNRNKVFRNMGFDTFTCLEYMNNVTKTPKNWAKDGILTECILDALKSTEERDYIYTISVQGHGKYPVEEILEDPVVKVTRADNEEQKWAYEYYANQVYEMDIFVKELTRALSNFDEDVVVVMYGDHLPALNMEQEDLKTRDLYETRYVIWSNFGLEKKDRDIEAYRMSSYLLDRLGIKCGMVNRYHDLHCGDGDYRKNLEILGYDMLYGNRYIYGGKNPYKPTDMQMGVKKIEISDIVSIGDEYYIKGRNFTEYSKISLDGEELKTVYLGPNILALNEDVDPEDVSRMKVSQIESDKQVLSTTE